MCSEPEAVQQRVFQDGGFVGVCCLTRRDKAASEPVEVPDPRARGRRVAEIGRSYR